jgi:NAD(P)-dependent dehydrogenase (short-subunit alcohol dehydrogenase family)
MANIFITGGARGIGLELARAFAAAGDHITVGVRDVAAARSKLPFAEAVSLDLADAQSIDGLAHHLQGKTIDVLINNAGILGPGRQTSTDMDFEGFLQTLIVNTIGPLRVTQALLTNLRASAAPRLVILTSKMGSLGYAKSDHVAYRASKAAANKVTQCLATDLAKEGVAVAALHPGWVRSDMGGPHADVGVAESAAGIMKVIEGLSVENTGRFWNYDGAELPW